MDIKVLRRDFSNRGGYKTKITDEKITVINAESLSRLEAHINLVTDTLFLGLSRGVRVPAMYTSEAIYNHTTDSWDAKNNLNKGVNFLQSATVSKSGNQIQTMTLTFNSKPLSLSDSTPLFFVYNTSTLKDYENDYVLFPRISNIVDNVVTVAMESNNAGSWGFYESSNNGEIGLSLGIDCLLQSTGESSDTNFYTPGIPDWTYDSYFAGETYLSIKGYVYNTIIETSDIIDWPCKVKIRVMKWLGDCATGGPWGGSEYQYVQDHQYKTGLHTLNATGLYPNTLYKIWVQIDSEVGQDNLEWVLVNCFHTADDGSGTPDNPESG